MVEWSFFWLLNYKLMTKFQKCCQHQKKKIYSFCDLIHHLVFWIKVDVNIQMLFLSNFFYGIVLYILTVWLALWTNIFIDVVALLYMDSFTQNERKNHNWNRYCQLMAVFRVRDGCKIRGWMMMAVPMHMRLLELVCWFWMMNLNLTLIVALNWCN